MLSEGDQRVWGQQSMMGRDRRLSVQLQAQELQQQEMEVSPEERAAAKREQERKRCEFVQKNMEYYIYKTGNEPIRKATSVVASNESSQCTICLGKFQPGDKMAKSTVKNGNCNHEFHYSCIVPWLVRKSTCPVCREFFLEADVRRLGLDSSTTSAAAEAANAIAAVAMVATDPVVMNYNQEGEGIVSPRNTVNSTNSDDDDDIEL